MINIFVVGLLIAGNYYLSDNILYKADPGVLASVIAFFPMVFGFWMGNIGVLFGAMVNAAILYFIAKKAIHTFKSNNQ